MVSLLWHLSWWLQPAPSEGAKAVGKAAKQASGPMGPAGCGAEPMVLFAVTIVFIYFLMWRPQQKRQKQHDAMLKALKKGDAVRTTGGIRGEIVEIGEKDVILTVADRVKLNVLRSNIAGLEPKQIDKNKAA